MRRNTPKRKIADGIICFLVAAIMIILMIMQYQSTSGNARLYTVPVTGTVQQCESYQQKVRNGRHGSKVKTYYAITIGYETDSGQKRTIERREQTRSYQKGEEVALMCNADTGEAVRKSETVQDPMLYIFLSLFSLAMIAGGVLGVKHGLNEL